MAESKDWGFEAAKMHMGLLGDARRQVNELAQRWNDIFAQEIMHATYAGKQSWMVPTTSADTELGGMKRIWTDKPLAEKTSELQEVITNLGKRVDVMEAKTRRQTHEQKQGVRY